jgi:endonuclease/exonuclease/phosphatase family metal-dependent hydrolase
MILYIIIGIVGLFALFLIFTTLDSYRPEPQINVFKSDSATVISDTSQVSLMTWNIGYCGLNAEMDFFYEGGKHVRPDESTVNKNIAGIEDYLTNHKNTDFLLIQEVDQKSRRSYKNDEYERFCKIFPDYTNTFGINYKVFFIPIPIHSPMGSVLGGISTFSRFKPSTSDRFAFPGNFAWPKSLFMPDRCFLVNRYPTESGKQLLIINTHCTTFDDGSLRDSQLEFLKDFIQDEYEKGNYVIVGGDWNECPPNFKTEFSYNKPDYKNRKEVNADDLSDWTWLYDSKIPSNRRVSRAYDPKKTLTNVIDFYLLSPNVKGISIKTEDVGFKYSDHQPVFAVVKLLK